MKRLLFLVSLIGVSFVLLAVTFWPMTVIENNFTLIQINNFPAQVEGADSNLPLRYYVLPPRRQVAGECGYRQGRYKLSSLPDQSYYRWHDQDYAVNFDAVDDEFRILYAGDIHVFDLTGMQSAEWYQTDDHPFTLCRENGAELIVRFTG